MPILVRPVREQIEHDRVIRQLQDKWRRKYRTDINPGDERTALVQAGTVQFYPDLILTMEGQKKPSAVVEVETGESVNHLEAMSQWATFAKSRIPFYLFVPAGSLDSARRLATDHQIELTELWTYFFIGEQIRFTPVIRTAGSAGDMVADSPVGKRTDRRTDKVERPAERVGDKGAAEPEVIVTVERLAERVAASTPETGDLDKGAGAGSSIATIARKAERAEKADAGEKAAEKVAAEKVATEKAAAYKADKAEKAEKAEKADKVDKVAAKESPKADQKREEPRAPERAARPQRTERAAAPPAASKARRAATSGRASAPPPRRKAAAGKRAAAPKRGPARPAAKRAVAKRPAARRSAKPAAAAVRRPAKTSRPAAKRARAQKRK